MPRKRTREDFIERARAIHGDKYDYSKVVYKGVHEKVCIICPKHGEFWQEPNNHISRKSICPKCSYEMIADLNRSDTDSFIKKARKVHGDKYDYSRVEYRQYEEKIKELFEVFLVQEALNTYSHQLRVPLKALDIRPAVIAALENTSIKTVADFVQYSPKELTKIPGIGPKAVEQIHAALRKEGMKKYEVMNI